MEKSEKSLKLVGYWVSLCVHRVRWALKLKGIVYEYIEEDIFDKTPLLSQINPVHGKVPVLLHNGNPLPESAVILEYIDDVWSHDPFLPQHPYHRSQARFWAKFADQKGEDQERAVKIAVEYLEKFEEIIRGKRYFGGEKLGYVDLMMGFVAYILPVWEEVESMKILDPSRCPAIAAWIDNFLNHPVIRSEYMPNKDEILTFYTRRRKEMVPLFSSETDLGKKLWSNVLS